MALLQKKFQAADLYLRCSDQQSLLDELKAYDADRFVTTAYDEEGNETGERLVMQSREHALNIVGDEVDQPAQYEEDENGELVVTQEATYTGKILVNLRFHRENCQQLAEDFKNHNWTDIELVYPKTPNQKFA